MFVIIYFLCSVVSSHADITQYDQRQTGDFNVQVDLKDLQIFGILTGDKEEYVDYDYAYDYSELTIKPQNRTTPKPLNVTSAIATTERIITGDNSTTATTEQEQTSPPVNNELTTLFTAATFSTAKDDTTTNLRSYPDITSENNIRTVKDVTFPPIHSSTRKICRKGYVLNQRGQCQLKMNTTENALLRLVKLSQKLKSRRENKSDANS